MHSLHREIKTPTMDFRLTKIKFSPSVMLYTCKLLFPKYLPYFFPLYMFLIYLKIVKRKVIYTVRLVPNRLVKTFMGTKPIYYADINNTIIINGRMIFKSDKLIKLCSVDKKVKRIAHVFPYKHCCNTEILVSETLFHNIKEKFSELQVRIENCYEQYISFASEVDVSLINSPNDISNSTIDVILKNYFETPKLVCKGDIIDIRLEDNAKEIFYMNNKINHVESIYFKCNKVFYKNNEVYDCYYCVYGETTVKQSVDTQSFLPRVYYCNNSNTDTIDKQRSFIPLYSYGMETHFKNIENAVKPFINKKKLKLNPIFLIQGKQGCGKRMLVSALSMKFGMHLYNVTNYDISANVYAQNETKLRNAFFTAKMAAPCIVSLENFENFGKNNEDHYDERIMGYFVNELHSLNENNNFPVILFCLSNEKHIPSVLKRVFLEIFEISAPNDIERELNLKWILESKNISTTVDLKNIANKTHGFLFADLNALVYYAKVENMRNCSKQIDSLLTEDNFTKALDYMQSNYNESLGAPKIPKVQWSDVGGLNDVKEEIIKTINLPLRHPELLKTSGLKRSGILLYGPPGTGKTLIAKAVATECSLCFLSVKGPELLNMYVGQSEQNVREVFERAREASPCIIFFDELDSLAPNRGMSGDSGGVMDRVVSQLLAEMDGLNESATIFIIGATNRPDLIDPALLRPGRFDKLLYVGPCTDNYSKHSVLAALTRKFKLKEDVKLEEVVDFCPANITGADFYGICSNAWTSAVRRLIRNIEDGSISHTDELNHDDVIVSLEDFKYAIENVKPSISEDDLRYFDKLRKELSSNK